MVLKKRGEEGVFDRRGEIVEFFEHIPVISVVILLIFITITAIYSFQNLDVFSHELEADILKHTIHRHKIALNKIYDFSNNISSLNYPLQEKKSLFLKLLPKQSKKHLGIIDKNKKVLFSNIKLSNDFINKIMKYKNIDKIYKDKYKNHIVFIKYLKKFEFFIVYFIDLNEIYSTTTKEKKEILEKMEDKLYMFLFLIIFILLVSAFLMFLFTNKIHKIFKQYENELLLKKHQAEEAAKTKAEFLANMSHEIRTPLNAILGFIQILREKNLDNESMSYLEIIELSGKDLVTIINDILDFSKIEAGELKIEQIKFNPKEQFRTLKELFQARAQEKKIVLEMNENLEYNIVSDPTRIKQVIGNLLSNAIKFTHSNKKVILNINYNRKFEKLYVEVIDEGIGIPKDKQKIIFQAFSQADTSTTRKYGGTGLGLAISYKLIELLGGELKVESEENKGSKFYFEIPSKAADRILENNDKKRDNKIKKKFQKYVLLLVEDNKANQMFMKIVLNKMGLFFDLANNGLEAFEKFKNNHYDVILMDENMPVMNGIEATKKIREYEKTYNLNHTIIIALTANAIEGDRERFIKAGMDFYLSKPLDVEKLEEILEKI